MKISLFDRMRSVLMLFVFITISAFSVNAQAKLDSLWSIWENPSEHDTVRLDAIYKYIVDGHIYSNRDTAYYYAELMQNFARENHKVYVGRAIELKGIVFAMKGDFLVAMNKYEEAFAIFEKYGNETDRAKVLRRIARTHSDIGNVGLALDYYEQALETAERTNDYELRGSVFMSIGALHDAHMNYDEALGFHRKCLAMGKKSKSPSMIAKAHNNLAVTYANKKVADSVYKYSKLAQKGYRQLGDSLGSIRSIASLGILYRQQEKYEKAIPHFQSIFVRANKINHRGMMMSAVGELTNIHLKIGNYTQAETFGKETLKIAREIGSKHYVIVASERLYEIYKKLNKPVLALEMLEQARKYKELVMTEEDKRELIHQEYRYEYLKKTVADSVKKVEEKKVADALLAKKQAENDAYEFRQTLLFGGLAVLIVFLGFVYNRFRVAKRQKEIIEQQKKKVEEQKAFVEEAAKTKLEMERLKQEYLKADLTNAAQEISRRQDWLEQFKTKLYKTKSIGNNTEELNAVFIDIANQIQLDARNQEFYRNIDLVNQEFFRRLLDRFPTITQKEQELCGLIRLNLSTKEIASVRNVEPHSIRIARSRLRKKLQLDRDASLFDFLQGI